MKLTYHQDGTEVPKVWTFTMGRFRAKEIEAVESRTKMNWGTDFKQALLQGNMLARRAMLWTLTRRDHPKMRFEDLDPFDDEVKVELNAQEWQEYFDEIEKAPLKPGASEEDREGILAVIAKEIADAKAAEDEASPNDAGKAPSEPSSTDTGPPSAN